MNPTADLAPPEHGRWGWLGGLVGLLLVVVATTVAVVTLVVLVDRRTGERKVAVVGDSLVAESTWPILDELDAHNYSATVAGVNGATVGDQRGQLYSLTSPGSAEILVAALGTNNAFYASVDDHDRRHVDVATTRRDIESTLRILFEGENGQPEHPSTRCVVWVNVNDRSPWLKLDTWGKPVNDAIAGEVQRANDAGHHVVLADWADTSREHDDWFVADRAHLTDAGKAEYARLIRDAVDECG